MALMNPSDQKQRKKSEVEVMSSYLSHNTSNQSLSPTPSALSNSDSSHPDADSKFKCFNQDRSRKTSLPASMMSIAKSSCGRNMVDQAGVSLSGSLDIISMTTVEERHRFDHPAAIQESEEERLRRERRKIFQKQKLYRKKSALI